MTPRRRNFDFPHSQTCSRVLVATIPGHDRVLFGRQKSLRSSRLPTTRTYLRRPAAYCTIFSPAYPSMFVKSQSESTPADKGFSSGRAVATTWRVIASTDQIARMHQTLLLYSLRQQHPRLLSTGTRLLVASNASDCCKALPSQIRPPQTLT